MIPDNLYPSTLRSLIDLQAMAEKISSGNNDEQSIIEFATFSEDIKNFLKQHLSDLECLQLIERIPKVEISILPPRKRSSQILKILGYILIIGLVQNLILGLLSDYRARHNAVQQIMECRSLYASLEWRLRLIQT